MGVGYSFLSTGGSCSLDLTRSLTVSGTPTRFAVDAWGNGRRHLLRAELIDSDEELFTVSFRAEGNRVIDWSNRWETITAILSTALPHWENPTATLGFPVHLSKLRLFVDAGLAGERVEGRILFDTLTAVWDGDDTAGEPVGPGIYFLRVDTPSGIMARKLLVLR